MSEELRQPIPVCETVLRGETLPGYERLLRKKRHEYLIQSQPFQEMTPDTGIGKWLDDFWLWDAENEEEILLNDTQLHDLNLALQKRYTLLQWEQGSGKTLAGIAYGKYRMDRQGYRNTWVISSAISIRNNWNVVLPNYDVSYVFVERLRDLERIKPGDFVLMTFNALCKYRRQIKKWLKIHSRKTCLVLDESDEICNPYSSRAKAVLSCFRRCQSKLLTTGTSTGNWPNEIVAIGVRHMVVLDAYAAALREAFPNRPLFIVTGATTTFAKRRALRQTLRESRNGILLCTQQSLPSSVNFEFVNKVIIPELHYNNSRMSQFYMRFIRFNSVDWKDIYFLTYAQSIESNLMQMILAKEKLNLFMKGDEADMDDIYERFGVDYDLASLLLYRDIDEDGHFSIRWGEQEIA